MIRLGENEKMSAKTRGCVHETKGHSQDMTGIHEVMVDPTSVLKEIVVDPGWIYCHDTGHEVMVYRTELVELGDYPDAYHLIHESNCVLVSQEFYEDEDMVGVETVFEVYMKGD